MLPRMVRLGFVRSPHAHAAVTEVDATAARALPGVVAVLTAADLVGHARPLTPRLEGGGFNPTPWPLLAAGVVEFVGQPVAVVAADGGAALADAREAVRVGY
ncbi:MAG: xanthine dehydrogenase family protein molybdopterin-binding subunit, partial [Candidatus Rokubacteria bacterium]|nr:xanthine dehydrogenase family protein molybdopterin-binding subunit [Candidatus Rokubacteria bacterium]